MLTRPADHVALRDAIPATNTCVHGLPSDSSLRIVSVEFFLVVATIAHPYILTATAILEVEVVAMPDLMGKKLRQGSAGRIPDSRAAEYQKYVNERYTCPPDLHARLVKYCDDEERAKSWVIQKALDAWLAGKGY